MRDNSVSYCFLPSDNPYRDSLIFLLAVKAIYSQNIFKKGTFFMKIPRFMPPHRKGFIFITAGERSVACGSASMRVLPQAMQNKGNPQGLNENPCEALKF